VLDAKNAFENADWREGELSGGQVLHRGKLPKRQNGPTTNRKVSCAVIRTWREWVSLVRVRKWEQRALQGNYEKEPGGNSLRKQKPGEGDFEEKRG